MKTKISVFLLLLIAIGCNRNKEQDILKRADEEYQKGNYKPALNLYEYFVQQNPKSPKAPEIFLKIAQIYLSDLRSPTVAVEYFEQIVQNYPNTKEEMKSLFMLGFIYANEIKDLEKAKKYYQKFLEKYPNSELAPSAKFELENLGKELDQIFINKQTGD